MKRGLNALIYLYPKGWRIRYKNEFEALLEDIPPTWRTVLDVFGGALKMQLKVWSSWKTVAAFALIGVVAAAAYTLTIPKRYVSRATLKYVDPAKLNLATQDILSRWSLTQLITEEDLYHSERMRDPIEDIIARMKAQDILIQPVSTSTGDFSFAISFQGPDAERAQRTTQRLTSKFLAATAGSLVSSADLPVYPANPRPSRNMIMGLLAGILLGTLIAVFNGLNGWKLAGAFGLVGLALGAGVAYLLPERYSSIAAIRCSGKGCDLIDRQVFAVIAPANLDSIVAGFGLYPNDPDPHKKLMENLHLQAGQPGFGAITIEFDHSDKYIAQKVTGDVASRLIDGAVRARAPDRARGQFGEETLELLDPPSLPWQPTFPNRPLIEGIGLSAGLAVAMVVGLWRDTRSALRNEPV